MILVPLFWLSTILPGYAVLCFLGSRRLGVLSTIARSYVLSLAVFTPLVLLAYLLHSPVAEAGTAYVIVVAISVLVCAVRRPPLWRFVRVQPWTAVAFVMLALALAAPLGATMHFDSLVHIAKIRQPLDVGFTFQDSYSPLPVPETRHMLGVHHALFSVGSWLTGLEPHRFWFYSAWFHRLLALGGIEALVMALYPSRRVAATVVLGALVYFLAEPGINFPALSAGFGVISIVLADVLRVVDRGSIRRYLALALSSFALGALHVAIWMMGILCIGIGVTAWFIVAQQGRRLLRAAGVCLALMAGLPFLISVAIQPSYVAEQQGDLFLWMLRTIRLPFIGATLILRPDQFLWVGFAASSLALMAVAKPGYRRQTLLLLTTLTATVLVMFIPPAPGLLMQAVPHWVVRRARFVLEVIAIAGGFGAVAWFVHRSVHTPWARLTVGVTALLAGVAIHGSAFQEWKWSSEKEHRLVRDIDDLQGVLMGMGGGRPMVAAEPGLSLILPAVRAISVMAPPLAHANPADSGLLDRHRDLLVFLDPSTAAARRRELAASYQIEWVLNRSDSTDQQVDWLEFGRLAVNSHGFRLYRLQTSSK